MSRRRFPSPSPWRNRGNGGNDSRRSVTEVTGNAKTSSTGGRRERREVYKSDGRYSRRHEETKHGSREPTSEVRRRYYSSPSINRHKPTTLRLENFDGRDSLQTHLAKYRNCQSYYGWTQKEATAHLCQSLTGSASEILWRTGPDCSESELIQTLENRFGLACQTEKHRQLLKGRRQARTEPTEEYFADILRLP